MDTEEIDFQFEREQAQEAITRAKKLIKRYNINYRNYQSDNIIIIIVIDNTTSSTVRAFVV